MLTRQQLILGERRPDLAVVIGEGALHQVVGGTGVMRAQLARLAEVSGTCPRITIQVLPFVGGAHPIGGSGPLSILRFADAPSLGVVHLPSPCGGIFLDSPPDVASHARAFTLLTASALTPAATSQLLRDMAARLQARGSGGRASPVAKSTRIIVFHYNSVSCPS